MALSTHEMFEKLMELLDLPADVRHDPTLADGSVLEDSILEQTTRVDYSLAFPTILPLLIFNTVATTLHIALQTIAATRLTIAVALPTITDESLATYWTYVVTNTEIGTGIVRELCEKQVPTLVNNRAVITAENETIRTYLVNTGRCKLEETVLTVGFSGLRMQATVDEETAAQSVAAFEATKAATTAKMATAAAEVVKRTAE